MQICKTFFASDPFQAIMGSRFGCGVVSEQVVRVFEQNEEDYIANGGLHWRCGEETMYVSDINVLRISNGYIKTQFLGNDGTCGLGSWP